MNKTQKALKMALGFAGVISETYSTGGEAEKVIQACKEALAQPADRFADAGKVIEPAQEPSKLTFEQLHTPFGIYSTPVDTHPAPSCQECENLKHDLEGYMEANKELINREWQGLSDDEIRILEDTHKVQGTVCSVGVKTFARAIEQALRIKNT